MAHEQELMALAVALYKDGELVGRIKRKLGISRDTLYRWLRDAGIEPGRYQTSSGSNLDHKLKKYATYLVDRAIAGEEDPEAMLKEFSKYVREGVEFRKNRTVSIGGANGGTGNPSLTEAAMRHAVLVAQGTTHEEILKSIDDDSLGAGFKKSMDDHPEFKEFWTEVPPPAEDELYDIVAEDLKKICRMCGNMLNTEFCCTWEG